MEQTQASFQSMPKADVHNHFHLGGSRVRFREAYPDTHLVFPPKYNGLAGMIDFLYNDLSLCLRSAEDVVRFMEISIQSSIDDGVQLLEASVDIHLARFFENSTDHLMAEVAQIQQEYKERIDFRPEIGINKGLDIKTAVEYTEQCIDSGIFRGIDLYGQEQGTNLAPFKIIYDLAKENKLKTKVHIGEFSDSNSIRKTIELLEPDEIQHGISAMHDDYVIDMILERDIRLNLCPESNFALGAAKDVTTHPIRLLFDKGVSVTINTDDLILFNKTVSEQMEDFFSAEIFSWAEMEAIRNNAFPYI